MVPVDHRSRLERALRLYLVADPSMTERPLAGVVAAALEGGVTMVQLRTKGVADRQTLRLATELAELSGRRGACFIVNDRVDIALACGADGVHLGVDDVPVAAARRLGGPDFVVGFSPETDEQARLAASEGADYLGVGPVYRTASKGDAGPAIGRMVLRRRVELAGIPVIGIGGIDANNAAAVLESGAAGVAVASAILRAADPAVAARELAAAVGQS